MQLPARHAVRIGGTHGKDKQNEGTTTNNELINITACSAAPAEISYYGDVRVQKVQMEIIPPQREISNGRPSPIKKRPFFWPTFALTRLVHINTKSQVTAQ